MGKYWNKTCASCIPTEALKQGRGRATGDYNSDLDVVADVAANLCTDLSNPSPLFLMASTPSSFFAVSSLYALLRPSTKALKSASSFSLSASFSLIRASRFSAPRAVNSSICFFVASSQRSQFPGPQDGPRVSACALRAAKSRPPL